MKDLRRQAKPIVEVHEPVFKLSFESTTVLYYWYLATGARYGLKL